MQQIFQKRCYDKTIDDPWQYLTCISQDCLPSSLLPKRVACGRHILNIVHPTSWTSHVSIDPCYSLLAKTADRQEEQAIAAMGKDKWMSPGCMREGDGFYFFGASTLAWPRHLPPPHVQLSFDLHTPNPNDENTLASCSQLRSLPFERIAFYLHRARHLPSPF